MSFGIDIDINAQITKFSGQIDKVSSDLGRFEKRAEGMAKKINSAFSTLGVGLSVAALTNFIKGSIDAADRLNDLSDRTGASVEALSGMQLALKLGDTQLDSFAKALNRLSINMAKNGEDFAALGVTAKDPLEAFFQLVDALNKTETEQERAALGAKTLGKNYLDMAPLIRMSSDELRNLYKQGSELAGVTTQQAKAAGEFNDRITVLGASLTGFINNAVLPALDPMNKLVDYLSDAGDAAQKTNSDFSLLRETVVPLIQFGTALGAAFEVAGEYIGALGAQITSLRNLDFSGFKAIGKDFQDKRTEILDEAAVLIQKLDEPPKKVEPKKTAGTPEEDKEEETGKPKKPKKATVVIPTGRMTAPRLDNKFKDTIELLKFEASIAEESADNQRLLLDIRQATAGASATEAAEIERLIRLKYEEEEATDILMTGNRLALEQQREMTAQRQLDIESYQKLKDVLANGLDSPLSAGSKRLNAGIATAQNAFKGGIIGEGEYKQTLDQLGQDFNAGLLDPGKSAMDQLSVYAEQAGRNIQDAFADFLFNPFEKGLDGLLSSFVSTLGRMAAEAASSEILELLKPAVKAGVSGLFGALGLTAAADGAVMTANGPMKLNRYASGGIAKTPQLALFGEGSMNEAYVPLPDGRSIPVTIKGGGSSDQITNNITVNVKSDGRESPEQLGQKLSESIVRAIARQEITSAARPGNQLNKTTSFG